jgi:putative phosphoserine phosphatase/1-acylglycerol-3-phosphate O-acyltransferase
MKAKTKPGLVFFDLDGTLLDGYSVLFFLARRQLSSAPVLAERLLQFSAISRHAAAVTAFEPALAELALGLRAVPEGDMWQLAEDVFARDLVGRLYPEARALVREHQQRGETVVILSSATQFQVEPIARELGIKHVLCTKLAVSAGKLTGMLDGAACYGEQKMRVAQEFANQQGCELSNCTFYSDGIEDLPLLRAVGHPRPTNPDKKLEQIAYNEDWPVQHFAPRGLPGAGQLLRTALVYGSLIPSFLLAAPKALFGGSRRSITNSGFSLWGDFGSHIAGLELEVSGEKNLRSHRPAVFVFNHQSAVDALIISRLLRKDFTGLAKSEMKANPLLGPVLSFADVVFIDRNKPGADAIQPAIEKLKQGISITVAPEGRRSNGRRLGAFRRGAFNIAMQAGVPVIPIVIENASDALPRSSLVIRPARIRIHVLKPISTRTWKPATLDQQVNRCRESFLQVLGQANADGQVKKALP